MAKMKQHSKGLKLIPCPDPRLVPKELVEQVKGRNFDVEAFYSYQLRSSGDKANVLLVIVDDKYRVVGFLWITVDGFEKMLFLNTISIDVPHQGDKELIRMIREYVRELAGKLGFSRIVTVSDRGKALERYGFEDTKLKIMKMEL